MSEWTRRDALAAAGAMALSAGSQARAQTAADTIEIDLRNEIGDFDHIWSRCAGSDRAAMTLREAWRKDLERFHNEAGLERIRFHGIFADELGVWSSGGAPNFQNVDAVYDGLLERGVAPFIELSFMPRHLTSQTNPFPFYGNNNPPTSMGDWANFIAVFARHLIERYGVSTVREWYFEVWNEANLAFFWSGTQAQYFELYKAAAVALKGVDRALKVGGPATSSGAWLPEFLRFCAENNAPIDFVSTHAYAGDNQQNLFGQANRYPQNDVIPAVAARARAQIDASAFPHLQLWLNEWSSDSPAMIAHVIKNCLPHCYAMGQWEISGAYEEIRIADYVLKEGNNGWSMFAARNIAKPQFNTYKLLHRLGNRRLEASGPALATRSNRGAAALIWNLANVAQPAGLPDATNTRTVIGDSKRFAVTFRGARHGQRARISYVDMERGSPFPSWRAMGSPKYPTPDQLTQLRAAAEIAPPETQRLSSDGGLTIDLPPEGVALIELQ